MGVPAFFRWLTRKYSSVIIDCIEERQEAVDGVRPPVDNTKPNPNEIEFDNLYLDMNGIIHPCTHPEDKPAPRNEDEMMVAIFECIDRLFSIVRPRKLLYMAIDGVAPRAKMNQQRSRRFRASKEAAEKIYTMDKLRAELEEKGAYLPPKKESGSHFDSNCITPGTPFMARLSDCLQYYIYERLNTDPGWRNIKVILSDANVPGEGEHKIMDYIRRQRAQPDHDPNTHHVLCGADADLIMLGLATHEPHFTIIREEFKPNRPRPCDLCRQMGHELAECTGAAKPIDNSEYVGEDNPTYGDETKYIFVRLSVLREYLRRDLEMPNLPFPYDFERAIDDWVFMCFFVGNDFLPHLPSLEIRENAIDRLVALYKDAVYKTGGFLTKSGLVNPSRVQMIMVELGKVEDEIFRERKTRELRFRAMDKARKRSRQLETDNAPAFLTKGQFAPNALGGQGPSAVTNPKQQALDMRKAGLEWNKNKPDEADKGRKRPHADSGSESDDNDEVRLFEDGFKDRYYESKFGISPDDPESVKFRQKVGAEYTYGLCWVLRYYYQGCSSWKWYFPYHYAPFASDFTNISQVENEFEKGTEPFKPLEQLMGVFPAASRSHVPEPWGDLMNDPEAPIIDFYPEDFKIDLNGKKFAWQGVALLPFVDETRLKRALEPYYSKLTKEEIARNIRGSDRLYVREGHPGYDFLLSTFSEETDEDVEVQLDGQLFEGMRGSVKISKDCVETDGMYTSPVSGLRTVEGNRVICVSFKDPSYPEEFIFPSERLPRAQDPPNVLKPGDYTPGRFGGRGGGGGRGGYGQGGYRPQIGFVPRHNQANLGEAGHRMLNHYGSVPPPQMMRQQEREYDRSNQRGFNDQSGPYANPYQQRPGHHQSSRGSYGSYNNDHHGGGRGGGGGGYNQERSRYDQQPSHHNHNRSGGYGQGRGGRGGGGGGGGYNNQRGGYHEQRNYDQRGGGHHNQRGGYEQRGNQRGSGGGNRGYYTSGYQGPRNY